MEQRQRRFKTYTIGMDKKPVADLSTEELVEAVRRFAEAASDDTLRNFLMDAADDAGERNEKDEAEDNAWLIEWKNQLTGN